jgi:flavin-dependent dehydrogenase
VDARFVVDASGRDALTAHEARSTDKIQGLDQTALFGHFEGVPRASGKLEGDIDIVLFRESADARPNWFWFIPFKDGRTSVGAVVSRAWIKDRRARLGSSAGGGARSANEPDDTTALFRRAVSESVTATEMLAPATMLWPRAEATADFSYRVRDLSGEGLLSVGDAAGFIDPLFSTGAHLAVVGAKKAAGAIAAALSGDAAPLATWERELRAASETFILAVEAFYRGPLVDVLFADSKHSVMRRSITSLLAGDVFHDAVWLRDARRRLTEMRDR